MATSRKFGNMSRREIEDDKKSPKYFLGLSFFVKFLEFASSLEYYAFLSFKFSMDDWIWHFVPKKFLSLNIQNWKGFNILYGMKPEELVMMNWFEEGKEDNYNVF